MSFAEMNMIIFRVRFRWNVVLVRWRIFCIPWWTAIFQELDGVSISRVIGARSVHTKGSLEDNSSSGFSKDTILAWSSQMV